VFRHVSVAHLVVRLTIFLMEVLDMESHLTLLDHFVVKLVPSRQAGKLGTWEMGYWMKEETISGNGEPIAYRCSCSDQKYCKRRAGRQNRSKSIHPISSFV
jgi:hypothetical protein